MSRDEVRKVVAAVLEETYTFWDGYYVPNGAEEAEYVDQVTDTVLAKLEGAP